MIKDNNQSNEEKLKSLGYAIRSRRLDKKMTQHELGMAAGVHRTYITDVENGSRNLTFLTLLRISSALHCELSEIVKDSEVPN